MSQTRLVQSALRLLADLGVREICVAAGARNAPVVAALLDSPGVRLWNFFEERSAAFFALGRILATSRPVAVLTTSGTAAAELLPAVIEAYYQALPLIAFTTDRPKRYRGTGAPQAIEQNGLFLPYTPTAWDIAATSPQPQASEARLNAPLHLNLCLEEPLAVNIPGIDFTLSHSLPGGSPTAPPLDLAPFLSSARPVVLVAGLRPQESQDITPLLLRLQVPIVAELTSNLWSNSALKPLLLPSSDEVLQAIRPTHVLRLGSVPTLRWWRDLEEQPELPVINVSRACFPGLARTQGVSLHPWSSLLHCSGFPEIPPQPLIPPNLQLTPSARQLPSAEPALLRALLQSLHPGSSVFLGNSLPVRECNEVAFPLPPGVTFHANRGANGIDGLISTWLGLEAETAPSDSWLILGDLSALYDLAGPWVLPQLGSRRRFLAIVNNGGGKIFSRVAGLRALPPNGRALIENRHAISFQPMAALWGMTHATITSVDDCQTVLSNAEGPGTYLLELCPDHAQTEAYWAASS